MGLESPGPRAPRWIVSYEAICVTRTIMLTDLYGLPLYTTSSAARDQPPMRIEVSVPGIWKDRGKLPALTTQGPLPLA